MQKKIDIHEILHLPSLTMNGLLGYIKRLEKFIEEAGDRLGHALHWYHSRLDEAKEHLNERRELQGKSKRELEAELAKLKEQL